ncbi:MAG: hypothetical protein ACLFS4_09065, partial [Opitutales bacterium]
FRRERVYPAIRGAMAGLCRNDPGVGSTTLTSGKPVVTIVVDDMERAPGRAFQSTNNLTRQDALIQLGPYSL